MSNPSDPETPRAKGRWPAKRAIVECAKALADTKNLCAEVALGITHSNDCRPETPCCRCRAEKAEAALAAMECHEGEHGECGVDANGVVCMSCWSVMKQRLAEERLRREETVAMVAQLRAENQRLRETVEKHAKQWNLRYESHHGTYVPETNSAEEALRELGLWKEPWGYDTEEGEKGDAE